VYDIDLTGKYINIANNIQQKRSFTPRILNAQQVMGIYNIDTHLNCFCYRDSQEALLEIKELQSGESVETRFRRYTILFVTEGVIHILYGKTTHTLSKGEFVFLPISSIRYRTLEKSTLLFFRMCSELQECPNFNTTALWSEPEEKRHLNFEEMYILKSNDKLEHFLAGVYSVLQDGAKCVVYMRMQISLLLFLIQLYYPREECRKFFSLHPTSDVKFAEFVRRNYSKYRTVNDLADAIHMSYHQFGYQFKKVFGVPPHQWIQREKAQLIYQDICRSDKTLKEIALQYEFDIHSNFIRFCRRNFGMSPAALRNSKKS
jgi:AraC-like DNA-binding protein